MNLFPSVHTSHPQVQSDDEQIHFEWEWLFQLGPWPDNQSGNNSMVARLKIKPWTFPSLIVRNYNVVHINRISKSWIFELQFSKKEENSIETLWCFFCVLCVCTNGHTTVFNICWFTLYQITKSITKRFCLLFHSSLIVHTCITEIHSWLWNTISSGLIS